MLSRVSSVNGTSYLSIETPPTNSSFILIFRSVFSLNHSKTFEASVEIS